MMLVDHLDGLGWTFLGADAAPLAIVQIDFHWYRSFDDAFGAIHPAKMAGGTAGFGWYALRVVYFRPEGSPVTGLAGFRLAKC